MGLSSKQVSNRGGGGVDWNHTLLQAQNLELPKAPMRKQQQQQENQQLEAVNCPRCDSINTKFCYYNNYNKSQPRHFCRACKRHWTKGGTLRNVPVGGGRKNKRSIKKSTSTSTSSSPKSSTNNTTISIKNANNNITIQYSPQQQSRPSTTLVVGDHHHKSLPPAVASSSQLLYQSMIHHPRPISLLPQQNNIVMSTRSESSEGKKDFGIGNGIFLSSTMPFPQNQSNLFPFSNSTSFDTNIYAASSTSLMNIYNHVEEEPTMNSTIIASTSSAQPWDDQMHAAPTSTTITTTGLEMSNYWSWEDIDSLVSTDLNASWNNDSSDIKP